MSGVRIITDSAAELSPAEAEDLGISVLPLRYAIGNSVYKQDVDIGTEQLLELISREGAGATILPPSEEDISSLLESIARSGDVALCVHVANGIVPVVNALQGIMQNLFGRARIEIVDTQALSYGLQRIVREAAKLAIQGSSLADVAQVVRAMVSHVYTLFYTEEFDYLEKSVDMQPAQAILANILGVKPLVALEEGRLLPLEKVTPRTTPVDKLTDFVLEFASVSEVAILVGPQATTFTITDLQQRIQQEYPHLTVPIATYGPLVAASVGPSAAGIFVYEGLQAGW